VVLKGGSFPERRHLKIEKEILSMNKKLMTLAVAGAFAAPAAAFAQASNVQIFGTVYLEYAYAKQGNAGGGPAVGNSPAGNLNAGDLVNVDILQSPGSEIGIKGEEALGGGTSVWFQCTSTADIRGSSTAGFCSRNSAIGVKGAFGNAYGGNWDMPMKRSAGAARIVSDTGIWGVGRMLYGDSSTFLANGTPTAFSRRQNNSLFYDTPNFSGFQGYLGVSTTGTSIGQTGAVSGSKPRMWSVAGTYNNGPLYVTLAYEKHSNFSAGGGAYGGDDKAWHAGIAYQFGPVKVGLLYVDRNTTCPARPIWTSKPGTWRLSGTLLVRTLCAAVTPKPTIQAVMLAPVLTMRSSSVLRAAHLPRTAVRVARAPTYGRYNTCTTPRSAPSSRLVTYVSRTMAMHVTRWVA
jgi:predicted porin